MATRSKPLVTQADIAVPGVQILETPEQGWAILEEHAQRWLGMSAQEFVEAWDRGDFAADPDRREVRNVAILLPLAR